MDLTKQPPRRPSNISMLGIVSLARLTDKARAHCAGTMGDHLYGDNSGLDKIVLEFLGLSQGEFADAAQRMDDAELCAWLRENAPKTEREIQAYNDDLLAWEPFDDASRQRLKDRLEKYDADPDKVKTMLQSMELDDWGCFRETDLTQRAPRSPYNRDVAGLYGVSRMADKARAARIDKLNGYIYNSPLDQAILGFLGISADQFQDAAYHHVNDIELGEWVLEHTDRTQIKPGIHLALGVEWVLEHADRTPDEIAQMNAALSGKGPEGDQQLKFFNAMRDRVAPGRTDVKTWFDLLDLDDAHSYAE